jgi:hypothetical protein
MQHCFAPKRRSNRRKGEKACWRSGLGVAHQCTEVAHGDASRDTWKFTAAGKSGIRPDNSRIFSRCGEQARAARRAVRGGFPCFRGSRRKFTRIFGCSLRASDFSDMATGRPRRLTRRVGAQDRAVLSVMRGLDPRIQEQRPTRHSLAYFPGRITPARSFPLHQLRATP